MIFADVIIDISVKSLDRPFQYIVPEEMEFDVDIGSVVKIPFGMGNRTMTGYVVRAKRSLIYQKRKAYLK